MRFLVIALLLAFTVSACGKKAPLRPPEEPQESAYIE